MEKLIKGLHKFQTEIFPENKDFYESLTKGQNPEVLFITCSDSRINPNLVTSTGPGDLFILRNAGNVIPPYTHGGSEAATIEFAIGELHVNHIIVCGHSYCGAIQTAKDVDNVKNMPALFYWIKNYIQPTYEFVKENYGDIKGATFHNILVQEHVLRQVEHLKTHPLVSEAIAKGNIILHAWVYQFETGEIYSYKSQEGQFERLKILEV